MAYVYVGALGEEAGFVDSLSAGARAAATCARTDPLNFFECKEAEKRRLLAAQGLTTKPADDAAERLAKPSSAPPPKSAGTTPMTADEVRNIQKTLNEWLKKHGYATLTVDGKAGPLTCGAARAYGLNTAQMNCTSSTAPKKAGAYSGPAPSAGAGGGIAPGAGAGGGIAPGAGAGAGLPGLQTPGAQTASALSSALPWIAVGGVLLAGYLILEDRKKSAA